MNQLYILPRPRSLKPSVLPVFYTLLILLAFSQAGLAQSGRVFRDFNSNGTYEAIPTSGTYAYGEPGVAGVVVTGYPVSGAPVSVTTGADGSYAITGLSGPVRLEFTGLTTSDFDSFRGTGSATSVQFTTAGATGINFGINYGHDYCDTTTPTLVTSCYVFGNQVSGAGNADPVIVSFPYTAGSRTILRYPNPGDANPANTAPASNSSVYTTIYDVPASHTLAVTALKVGTTFGMTYARLTKKLFAAAFFKKHTGFGPGLDNTANTSDDAGAIYRINAQTGAIEATYTVPNATTNSHNTADYIRDNDDIAWNAVGTTSLGGMDLSDDEKTLYVMNLQDRKLYALDAATGAVIASQSIPLTYSGFTNAGDARPLAVEFYRNKVYVGIVNSAQSTGNRADMKAFLFTADPTTLVFSTTPVFQFALNYPRGKAASTGPGDWRPWTASYTNISTNLAARIVYPMPMVGSIAFDNGNLILGMRDRLGDIAGNQSKDKPGDEALFQARTAGDILRASGSPQTGWTLENAGRSNGNGTATQNTGQGPGGAEFYQGDAYPLAATTGAANVYTVGTQSYTVLAATGTVSNGSIGSIQGIGQNHDENSLGTVLQVEGLPDMIATVFDPTPDNSSEGFFDGGMRWLNNTTGSWVQSYRLFNGDGAATRDLGKANGLGGLVAFCNPAPIQIGNRVWNDANNNGVQDPNEAPLAGVTVTLKGPGLPTAGATVTTNSAGEYYFSNATGTTATGFVYSLTGLVADGAYTLTFPVSFSTLSLSAKPNMATGANADAIDTDPNAGGVVSFTLGQAGQNNFSYDAGYRTEPCSITIKPTVSGCYATTAGSKATVSLEVAWSNAPASETISVTYAGQTRTITPGAILVNYGFDVGVKSQTIVSPQVVAFEVAADGSTGQTASASFTTSTTCTATSLPFNLPAACPPTPCSGNNVGGTIFNDFNADGIKQTGESTGVPGVTVNAYDCTGKLIGSNLSDANGAYSITAVTAANYPVRIEFVNLPTYAGMGTVNGANGRTTVQFINAPTCTADLGVLDRADYCQTNPRLILPCYVYGDPLPAGSPSGKRDALVAFDYTTSGLSDMTKMQEAATAGQVGTVWGVAYNRVTKKVFTAATIKRHAGLGPLGIGGIYVTDYSNPAAPVTTPLLSVTALGVDVGTIPDNATRGLVTDPTKPTTDKTAYLAAGKIGIGGIELSDDGNKLYFTNLKDNKLYEIDMTAYNAGGTLPTSVKSYDVGSTITCTGGEKHIWAVKVRKGKVYTGFVCDAGTSQSKSDLRAYVQELNGTAVSTIFDFPLTYPKGPPVASNPTVTGWFPWTDDWTLKSRVTSPTANSLYEIIHPEPIFESIEFDIDGSLVLALGDRTGIQSGYKNWNPNGNDGALYSGNVGGDLLRAFSNGTSYVLENNAKAGLAVGYGANNNQGPGFGEFYNDNFTSFGSLLHAENMLGGLALRPGSGEVIAVAMDPLDVQDGSRFFEYIQAGGVRHMNNTTGQTNSAYVVYTSYSTTATTGTFGKATGLGDVALLCNLPTYLEIGNRVWVDANKDGVQDPCEKPLAGVTVSLYQGNTLVGSTVTNASGEYYFNNNPVSSTVAGTVSTTAILPNTAYQLVFGNTQFANNVLTEAGVGYTLTTANSTVTNANDMNDSDALVATVSGITAPVISVTTGAAGTVNHTFDVGFACVPTVVASLTAVQATCTGATANADAKILLTGIQNGDKAFIYTTSIIPSYTAVGGVPVSASAVSFTGLSNPATAAGQSYSVIVYNGPCCYTVVSTTLVQQVCLVCNLVAGPVSTTCNPANNQYTLTGTVSLTNATAQSLTVTDGTATQTVSVSAGQTSASYSLTGSSLVSNQSSHTVTVTSVTCGTSFTTYSAPASCTPVLGVATTTPVCNTATNQYTTTTTVSLTNATAGTLTLTDNGTGVGSQTITAGQTTATFTLTGVSGSSPASHSVVASLTGTTATASTTYATPASCTVCSLSLTTSALPVGQVGTTYSQTLTTAGGTAPLVFSTVGSLPAGLTLNPDGSITGTPTSATTASFTAVVTDGKSCSATVPLTITVSALPVCSLTATATPTACNTVTNQYAVSGTVSATNTAINGAATQSLTISVGTASTVVTVTGNGPVSYTLAGLTSDGLTKTVTVTGSATACGTTSASYTAPASCSVAPPMRLGLAVLDPPVCNTATNTFTTTGAASMTNVTTGAVLTVSLNGAVVLSQTLTVGQPSATYNLTGISNAGINTITASLSNTVETVPFTLTFVAPVSCSTTPPSLTVVVSTPVCNSATNQYTATGTVSLTNVPANATLTITDNGTTSSSQSLTVGQTSASFSVSGISNAASHTVVATLTNSVTVSSGTSYTAPVSCTVCSLSLTTSNLPNGQVGTAYSQTLTTSGGTAPLNFSAIGSLPAGLSLTTNGVISGTPTSATTASFTAVMTDGKSCSVAVPLTITTSSAPACSLTASVTSTTCNPATNTYASTVSVTLVNPVAGVLTLTDGTRSLTLSVTGSTNGVSGTFNGLISDGNVHTVSASLSACGTSSTTYTAPASCSIAPPCSISATVTAGVCNTATNTYSATAVVTVTNPVTGSVSVTIGGITQTLSTTAGFSQNTLTATVSGLTSDGTKQTVTVISSATACGQTSVTYTAPASCSVALKASLGDYIWLDTNKDGFQDGTESGVASVTVTLCEATSGTAISTTVTDGTGKYLFGNLNPGSYVVKFTAPAGTTFTVPNSASATPATDSNVTSFTGQKGSTAPVSLSAGEENLTIDAGLIPVVVPPSLTVVTTTPVCNTATNQYTTTTTVSLTNATIGTLTLTDNGTSVGSQAIKPGQTTATFTLTGVSGSLPGSHSVVASLVTGTTTATASTTYATPASCTVCSLSLTTAMLPNGQVGTTYSQTLTTSGGTAPVVFSAIGTLPAGLTLNPDGSITGIPMTSGTSSFTVKVTDGKSCSIAVPLTITASTLPVCVLTATATPPTCNTATNQYAVTGTVSATNTPATQSLTVSVGSTSTVVTLTGNGPASYTLTGLTSDGANHTVTVMSSATACGMTSVTYTAPTSCSVAPTFDIAKVVNVSKAKLGDVLSYTVTVTNTSPVAGSVVATDVLDSKLAYVPNSASTGAGTYTPATGKWLIASLPASATATLTFSASVLAEGVVYNTASIDSKTATVCTSIPTRVCAGTSYAFSLSVTPGQGRYQWYRDDVLLQDSGSTSSTVATGGSTPNVFTATSAGAYRVVINQGVSGKCPDNSCCPFVIEEVSLPAGLSLTATAPTCIGTTPQTNGSVTLTSSTALAGLTYQYSTGGTGFSATSAKPVPASTLLAKNLLVSNAVGGSTYFVRVFGPKLADGEQCFTDLTVVVPVAACACPTAPVCVPVTISKRTRTR